MPVGVAAAKSLRSAMANNHYKTIFLTILALLAFAGNSVLCRLALKDGQIDPSSFTVIRFVSGALFLVAFVFVKQRFQFDVRAGSWLSAFFLFAYGVTFSFAYVSLDTGTGALLLFGSVQISMIIVSVLRGQKLTRPELAGVLIAFLGLAYLLLPGAQVQTMLGFALMVVAGMSWAGYTLGGTSASDPLLETANNFVRSVPFCIVLGLVYLEQTRFVMEGVWLAVLSGVITSGVGYAIWYAALKNLSVPRAAVVQLSVPVIAAFGGVVFSNESITIDLMVSSVLVLGGILIVIGSRQYAK